MKLKLFILFTFIGLTIYGQEIFPAEDTSIISGKELKVTPLDKVFQSRGYEGFYKDEKLKKKYECCDGFNSKYNSLVDKIFKVVSITPYKDILGQEKFKIKLNNPETGDIYFDYDSRYEFQWHFQFVGDFTLPTDFYCRNIKMTADKFTGDTTYTTPASDGFTFIKIKKGENTTVYLAKNQPGSTLTVGKKRLILLLENGKRFEKPDAELNVKASSYGSSYIYSAFVELSDNDIKLLTENAITDARPYIYDDTVKDGKKLTEFLKCLVQK